jgi:hypothetical protein
MRKIPIIICLFCLIFQGNMQAQKFRTSTFSDMVKTLRVFPLDRWDEMPVIELESGEMIEINFDVMDAAPGAYTYTITHCNADWTHSELIQSEYMSGFQNRFVDDFAISFNTKMNYVNYRLLIPNEDITLRVSGNYVVQIFPENSNKPVLNACFSVLEKKSEIVMQVTPQTDKGMNNYFQQISLSMTYNNSEVRRPMQDLQVYVRQNNRTDNEASLVKPLRIQGNQLIFEHIPSLIFDAGNEYRVFEMITHRNTGINIENIRFYPPYYHVSLFPDRIRAGRAYSTSQDINGRMFIRTLSGDDSDTMADYHIVHFFLTSASPLSEDVYILSEAFNYILDERSKMDYDSQEGGYVKSVLLKEGYYNYLYLTKKNAGSQGSTTLTEGNYYQTENEYQVLVYFRRAGDRYDQLIGVQTVQFK